MLLTDAFENFGDLCLEYYGLEPAHYFLLPNFAWDAMLLKTGIEIGPLYDKNMYEMMENSFRGGMCQVNHKEAEAMMDDCGESKRSNYYQLLGR